MELEVRRQLFHLIAGIIAIALIWQNILTPLVFIIIILIGLILSLLSKKHKLPGMHWFLKTFARKDELKTLPGKGPLTFMLGMLLAMVLFQRDVALAAITILVLADSISHLVGRFYGRIKHPFSSIKFLEGAVAGTIAGFLGAMLFVSPLCAFTASLGAMIIEGIEMRIFRYKVDDNLTIPLIAGGLIIICRILLS